MFAQSMIPKSGHRFSEKIMLHQWRKSGTLSRSPHHQPQYSSRPSQVGYAAAGLPRVVDAGAIAERGIGEVAVDRPVRLRMDIALLVGDGVAMALRVPASR